MFRMSRKEAFRQCKKVVKYGVFFAICYWVVISCIRREEQAELTAAYYKTQDECRKKLAGMERVPIRGGTYIDRTLIPGFYVSSSDRLSDDSCAADILSGSFWWTGTEMLTAEEQRGEPLDSWGFYQLKAGLYTRERPIEPRRQGYRHVNWPDELIVKLKNYPGLELWLDAPPPHFKNEFSINTFVMSDWKRSDDAPRLIVCDGLNISSPEDPEERLNTVKLLKFNRSQLEQLDLGRLNVFCSVGIDSFDFAGGAGRIRFGTGSLRGAPEALKFVSDHLSRSIVTGK